MKWTFSRRAPGSCGKWSLSGPLSICKSHVGDSTVCSTTRDREAPRPACPGTGSANVTSGCTPATGFSSEAPVAYLWVPQSWDRECTAELCSQTKPAGSKAGKKGANQLPPSFFWKEAEIATITKFWTSLAIFCSVANCLLFAASGEQGQQVQVWAGKSRNCLIRSAVLVLTVCSALWKWHVLNMFLSHLQPAVILVCCNTDSLKCSSI